MRYPTKQQKLKLYIRSTMPITSNQVA